MRRAFRKPLLVMWIGVTAVATPPEYATFERDQRIAHEPPEDDIMRIWTVYVAQGDGLLIQLPTRFNYDPDPEDDDPTRSERVDIMIDGGAMPESEAWRMTRLIEKLYGAAPVIEHAVITHHDFDHVSGLTHLLTESEIEVEVVYHNGLASYRPGARGFPVDSTPENAIYKSSSGRVTRGMAFLEDDGETMQADFLVNDRAMLMSRQAAGEFQGVYAELAHAIVGSAAAFPRVHEGSAFVAETETARRGIEFTNLSFELLWPLERPRKYGDWGETINGNSVTFAVRYRDFEMLFTGDHNENSEEAFLEHLGDDVSALDCDVLKVPHHGSAHGLERFFRREGARPVVSVCSMGPTGFKSKRLYASAWQHPSTDVIRWLGGSHRVYHTLIHEKRFKWDELTNMDQHRAMYEFSHILVETDGRWFRLVEVQADSPTLAVPDVADVRRSNGTRWVKTK